METMDIPFTTTHRTPAVLLTMVCITCLSGSAADIPPFVFTKHFDMGGSHYAYTEAVRNARSEYHFHGGSALCRWRPDGSNGIVDTLLSSGEGVIRDPDVSWDAERILFSWKKSSRGDDYHLYEMDIASGDIRQLTFGEELADYEAAYLPNGDIVFNSTRCIQRVDCFTTPVSNLFLCDRDGRYMRRIGYDQVHTNYPTVLSDGRVIYTRWDYNDRGQIYPQPLFVMNPDGSAQTEMYGNNSFFPTSILHARGIPETGKIVGIFSGHHSRQQGKPAIINPRIAKNCPLDTPVDVCGIEYLIDVSGTHYEKSFRKDNWGQDGDVYQYPYPLSEDEFIIGARLGTAEHFSLYYLKIGAEPRLLVSDPAISCNQPVPLVPRTRPPKIASKVDYTKKTGTFSMQDVYIGEAIKGIERGTIKKLRVIALEFRAETNDRMAGGPGKASGFGISGPGGRGDVYLPVSLGLGSWDVKRVLGDATVYEDGSAYFEVPASTPVYFQALNEKGHAVQTMRSWSTLMPGEHFSCVGCHEDKLETPPPMSGSMAMANGVEKLEEFYGPPRGFSFAREIQPILDKHCVSCHNASHAKLDLTDSIYMNYSRDWFVSYRNLTHRDSSYISIIGAQSTPEMLPPYFAGAAQSMLVEHLETQHRQVPNAGNDVVLSTEEMDKIACWIDLLAPFAGDYREGMYPEMLERYNKGLAKREAWEKEEAENIAAYVEAMKTAGTEPTAAPRTTRRPVVKSVRLSGDGQLHIETTGTATLDPRISLFDMSGRMVFSAVPSTSGAKDHRRFSASVTANRGCGMYVLRIAGDNFTSNHIVHTGHVSRRP